MVRQYLLWQTIVNDEVVLEHVGSLGLGNVCLHITR